MKKIICTSIIAMLSAILFSGCTGNKISLVDTGLLAIEKQAEGKVYIAWCDAYKGEKGIVVTTVLRRKDHIGLPVKKHVDIKIFSPEGSVLDEAHSADRYIPRDTTGRFESFQRFNVSFPNLPPKGSLIHVIVCDSKHKISPKNLFEYPTKSLY